MITVASRVVHLPERYGTAVGVISFDNDSVIPPTCIAKLASFYDMRLITRHTLDAHDFGLKEFGRLCAFTCINDAVWPELIL